MSGFGDSPDPQIIQLRNLLLDAIAKGNRTATNRNEVLSCLALAERLIEQYPVLTEATR